MSTDHEIVNYQFSTDEGLGILSAVATGFWTVDTAYKYIADIEREADMARRRFGRLRLLVDASATQIQSQDVISIFNGFEYKMLKSKDGRAATIASSALSKMQMERSYTSDQVLAFLAREPAIQWLMSDQQHA